VIFVIAATAGASLLYAANFHPQRVPAGLRFFGEMPPAHGTIGGTPLGLIFGATALGIFVFAALLGLRKKIPGWRIGHVQQWLRAHIWLTLLTIPLILLHSGFHLGGPMTTLLMALYAIVMVSGIYGLILQHRMPTLMKERLPAEIVYEQIPNIRAQLSAAAERLLKAYTREPSQRTSRQSPPPAAAAALATAAIPDVSEHAVLKTPSAVEKPMGGATIRGTPISPAAIIHSDVSETEPDVVSDPASEATLADFIQRQLLPYLQARRGEKFRLGHARQAEEIFSHLALRVAGAYRPRVEEMQGWCDERRLLDVQTKMQNWLHGWLLLHAPLSFLLLLVTVWHAFVTLFNF
jgi:hypothetical protein